MIRPCRDADVPFIEVIITEATRAYEGVIPSDCWHEPYMPRAELLSEIAAGVQFWGWEDSGSLIGVMGIQKVRDATLIRHARMCCLPISVAALVARYWLRLAASPADNC